MKTFLSILTICLFSALVLTPVQPKQYPPERVVEQQRQNAEKAKQIECYADSLQSVLCNSNAINYESKR